MQAHGAKPGVARALVLLPADNKGFYIGENAPASIFCPTCGCITDKTYRPTAVDVSSTKDFSYTLDSRVLISQKAARFLEELKIDGLSLWPLVTSRGGMYLLDTKKVVRFDTSRRPVSFEGPCMTCGEYLDVFHALPVYLKGSEEVPPMGLVKTDLEAGHKDRKGPFFILGHELASLLKKSKMSGIAFDTVRD